MYDILFKGKSIKLRTEKFKSRFNKEDIKKFHY